VLTYTLDFGVPEGLGYRAIPFVRALLAEAEAEVHSLTEGEGVYKGETEGCITAVVSGDVARLRRAARLYAILYNQDSVALTTGATEFITQEIS